MNNRTSEKYTRILIILLFVIPLLSINLSLYLIANINYEREKKQQESKALHEAETLSVESDFNNAFSSIFKDFFEQLKSNAEKEWKNKSFLITALDKGADRVFEDPFPEYKLYVFKIPSETQNTDLIFYKDNYIKGKKILCRAFEHIYQLSKSNNKSEIKKIAENITNEKSAKVLLGDFTDLVAIAKEFRGTTVFANGIHKNCWFIWDYYISSNKDVYGAILISNEVINYREKGRLIALKKLKSRRVATGGFVPLYKNYGKAELLTPLDKSDEFNKFAQKLTIQEDNNLEQWLKEPLPQGTSIGKYTAYCHLGKGSTHIAVVLVKSLNYFSFPKWLICVDIFSVLSLIIILYCGICFGKWPQISLKIRFALSYLLASVLPLSLLTTTAYGYLLRYENTEIDQANTELQTAIKTFDAQKLASIKDYRKAFKKAINDPTLIKLIEEYGISNPIVTNRVVEIFEKNNLNSLPVLGVKILDEKGKGAISKGSLPTDIDVDLLIKSFQTAQINLLIKQINFENEGKSEPIERFVGDDESDLANKGYKSIMGRNLDTDLSSYFSVPIKRKNGDFCCYQIFDFIKVSTKDGIKTKYMLFVVWDDKTLDEKIIQEAFDNYSLKNKSHYFLAYKTKGNNKGFLGKEKARLNQNVIDQVKEYVELAEIENKPDSIVNHDNIIVIRPALNFNHTIFVGWIDKFNITLRLLKREIIFYILAFVSLLILFICSIRSSLVFLKPVSILKKALDDVSSGNLNVILENAPKDELGLLSNDFSEMIEDLKEKERLSKLISDQAVQVIQKDNNNLLNNTESFSGVALVSDIRNFTGMSESYDPIIITDLLNEHFAEMTKIISDNGGLIYKFIGDAIEAIFPEKGEFDKSASERAFNAGCMMISKLAVINNRRSNKNLFTYRIGVGLCYGIMHSGSVGSLETRLDYAILGEPLKKAAKFEALSIQNKEFPIVIEEYIADKIATLGYELKKLDDKNLGSSVYSLNKNSYEKARNLYFDYENKNKFIENNETKNKKENTKVFSLTKTSRIPEHIKLSLLIFTVIIFLFVFIITGFNIVFSKTKTDLISESSKECYRLIEQLKSENVLCSAFEALCFKLYEDINESLKTKDSLNKQEIEKIVQKYEALGYPIPKYHCCFITDNEIKKENLSSNGFSPKTCDLMDEYVLACVKMPMAVSKQSLDRKNFIKKFMLDTVRDEDLRSSYYRRAALTTIDKEEMFFFTTKIFDSKQEKFIGYLFCGLPKNYSETYLANYYTLLAGNNLLLAIKNKNKWYYSNNFPQKEKDYLNNNTVSNIKTEKGYFLENIEINNETCAIYVIKKDLLDYYNSIISRNSIILLSLIFLFSFIIIFLIKKNYLSNPTVATKLRIDILVSSILPVITVAFVSYLYVNEAFNVKKSEVRYKLNKLMDEIEEREYYYNPLCETFIKDFAISDYIKQLAFLANKEGKQEKKKSIVKSLRDKIKENCLDGDDLFKINPIQKQEYLDYRKYEFHPHFNIREIVIVGKNDWVAGHSRRADQTGYDKESGLSQFGKILVDLAKTVYLKGNVTNNNKSEAKGGLIIEPMLKALSSIFGNLFTIKIVNFPDNLNFVTVTYNTVGIHVATVYSDNDKQNLEYVLFALIFFDNELKPRICNLRNDKFPLKDYIISGAKTDNYYVFYSPNVDVGQYFFYDFVSKYNNCINKREELKTLKELDFIASWINASYLPVSISTELYGKHLIEARQGNKISDNVYVAMASEYPIKKEAYIFLPIFASIILFSIIMIYSIVQISISDLLLPIKRLIEGVKSVEKGDYKFRTEFSRNDELGILCDSFDKMMKGLEEKQLMNRMVSKSALNVASNHSENESKKVDVVLLYISVPDFDKIMKRTPIDELFYKLRKQIANIAGTILEAGGDIDKIMGEKLLIAFNIEKDKIKESVLMICKTVQQIIKNDNLDFEVAIGVNYGQVISGYLGVGEKRDFTVIGDPVNVSARIESLAEKQEENRLLISETFYKLAEKEINARIFGEVELKGKSQPMKVYVLTDK